MKPVYITKIAGGLIIVMALCFMLNVPPVFSVEGGMDHTEECTVRIIDKNGRLVTMTARKVFAGDEIITAAGNHYRVIVVEKNEAQAELLGQNENYLAWTDFFDGYIAVAAVNWGNRPVGVYHTHSDESYLPTDGESSIPFRGGIYRVGNRFVKTLRDNEMDVKYYQTPHDPHDNNAYTRSRRTAMGLLKSNPIALFDIHRDGVPDPDFFKEEVSGEEVAQLRIVVGRQNPKMKSNMEFAQKIMAYANKAHPGLVKEIYRARGNYNQDLLSTAILLEAGTYTNNRELAENGIKLLAEAVPVVLGVNNTGEGITSDIEGKSGWNIALWLILLTLLAGSLFSILNFGWQGTVEGWKKSWRLVAANKVWLQIKRAGTGGKGYLQGLFSHGYRSAREKIQNAIMRKNKQ